MIISRQILLSLRNVSDKVVEKTKTRILHSVTFFSENRAVYEINIEKYGTARQATDDNIIRRMHYSW
jgi:hypothetical protein